MIPYGIRSQGLQAKTRVKWPAKLCNVFYLPFGSLALSIHLIDVSAAESNNQDPAREGKAVTSMWSGGI